jgi:hypothetical protein
VLTDEPLIEASVAVPLSVLVLILVPAAGRLVVPVRNPKPNEPGVNDPAVGVRAHAVQRLEHRALSVLDAGRRRRHGDHQADAERKTKRDEHSLARTAT